jgi:FlaA1/EpsC-like NDP-sugar epimerase
VDILVCSFLVGVSRFWERGIAHALRSFVGRGEQRRTLIVGAGGSGRSLLRELRESRDVRVIGFVDDDQALRHRRIQGVPVVGSLSEIGWVLGRYTPDAVLVTTPPRS